MPSPSLPSRMLDSSPPNYTESQLHRHARFFFSSETVDLRVEDTHFKVHKHFLSRHSPLFRAIFLSHPTGSNTNDNGSPAKTRSLIRLHDVTVLEFEALLTFFYESWQEGFTMSISSWVALLSIAHRFKVIDAESRARREVFQRSPSLDPVKQLFLAEKHSVPISFIIPALEVLVRRPQPLQKKEIGNLSREMTARLCSARERYVRESSRMFVSEPWLKQVASNIVTSLWPNEKELA